MTVRKNRDETRQAEPAKTNWHALIWALALGTIGLGGLLLWFVVYT